MGQTQGRLVTAAPAQVPLANGSPPVIPRGSLDGVVWHSTQMTGPREESSG